MHLRFIWPGKTKDERLRSLVNDYLKRISRFARCEISEVRESTTRDASAVETAGAFSVVLEIVAPETAKMISQAIQIPTIGIGSGKDCDGQILVTHDLIGLFPWFTPKFVAPEANVAEQIRQAARAFVARTRDG